MADNVPITAGSGTYVATDDVSSVHYQRIKLDGGGDGVASPIVAGQTTMSGSLPVAIASNQTNVPVTNADTVGTVYIGSTSYTVKRANIGASTAGANTLVSAVVSKKLYVLGLHITASGAASIYFYNSSASTGIWGTSTNTIDLLGGTPYSLPYCPHAWFITSATNEALMLNISSSTTTAVSVAGGLLYIEV